MNKLYNVKDLTTELYYSDDKVFIEPNKECAKKMKIGQARSIAFENNRIGLNWNRYACEETD